MTQDGTEQTLADLSTFRHHGLSKRVVAVKHDVAAFLTDNTEAGAFEGGDTFTA